MTVFVACFHFGIFGCMHNLKQTHDSVLKTVAWPRGKWRHPPRAQPFEGVIWGWNVTQQLRNVKCQRMLVITIYKTSNASRWYPVAKSHKDRQISHREQLRTLVMFSGGACVFINQLPHVLWLMVASQCFQIARLANFPTSFSFCSCVTMDGNPAFTVHATAHAFRAAINFNSMLLRQHIWCLGN